jgi:hypothetical protein
MKAASGRDMEFGRGGHGHGEGHGLDASVTSVSSVVHSFDDPAAAGQLFVRFVVKR